MRAVLRVFLTLALAVSCSIYMVAEKQVTVTDGEQVREVKTYAATVGSALTRLGVEVGPNDRVMPGRQAQLLSDRKIEVRRAKNVVVVLNGARSKEFVTGATVSEVLHELEVKVKGARVDPSPASSVDKGEEIVVAQPAPTSVYYDGVSRQVVTNALTAGALLRELGITLGPHDRVEPSIVARPSAETPIRVVRIKETTENITSKIPYKRLTENSDELELGTRKIKIRGAEGVLTRVYKISYEDGKVRQRVFEGSKVTREPVDEVMLVGTKRPVLKESSHSQTGIASWYSQPGLMAAHRSLPFGTIVKVTNLGNGKTVTVTIRDRGPFTGGRIIDLSDVAFEQIAPLGSGVINVKIEW